MKHLLLLLVYILLSEISFAQTRIGVPNSVIDKTEMANLLQIKSQRQRSQAWGALIGGSLISSAGIIVTVNGNRNLAVNSTNYDLGKSLFATGLLTTIASVPLFSASAKNKKAAMVLLSEDNAFMTSNKSYLALGLRFNW